MASEAAPSHSSASRAPGADQPLASPETLARWRTRFPLLPELMRPARGRIPYFAWDFLDGGTGAEHCTGRNRAALDAITLPPRYGLDVSRVDTSVELFGSRYAAPLVVAPIGMDGMIWPGAPTALARAAHAETIPYTSSTMSTVALETLARLAPEGFWFQLYGLPEDDHAGSLDLARRAGAAGAKALVITLDIPRPSKRARDLKNGLSMPFRIKPRMMAAAASRPHWLAAVAREGMPGFANMAPYCGPNPTREDLAAFVQRRRGGGFAWEIVARIREAWSGPLVVKGLLHPADAERAVAIGADGIVVSNHGGRQFDGAPAPIDVLPAIRAAVGPKPTILVDGGILFGLDILKAVALGADAVMAGRAFMLGLAALGPGGGLYVARTLAEELSTALAQCGLVSLAETRSVPVRHPGAWSLDDFSPRDAASALPTTGHER